MSTLYDLFKVNEDASIEEIKEAYNNILKKADSLPQNDKTIEQVRRIKIAYGILTDTEKRAKYDSDLANKKANELLENIQIKPDEAEQKNQTYNEDVVQEIESQINNIVQEYNKQKIINEEEKLKNEKELIKQTKKENRQKRRLAKKRQQIEHEMRIQAYGDYLQKQGYKVKYPWTIRRVKRLLISILTVIIALFIIWHIPSVRKTLTDLYNENFLVKMIADMIITIFKSIADGIKNIFNISK